MKAVGELRRSTRDDYNQVTGRLNEIHDDLAAINKQQREIKVLKAEVAVLKRGLPAPAPPTIKDWKLDPASYRAVPVMTNGAEGPAIELRGFFEAYHAEVAS